MSEIRLEAQDLNQQAALLLKAGNPETVKAKLDYKLQKHMVSYASVLHRKISS